MAQVRKTRSKRARGRGTRFSSLELASRMRDVVGMLSNREVADRTGANHETVRRYLIMGNPTAEFLHSFSRVFDVSTDWLLGLRRGTRR